MTVPEHPVSQEPRRFAAGREPEVEGGLTKQQLYARAKALDIPRRSAMTKGELARAIARREG
jgi:hypothetical protein